MKNAKAVQVVDFLILDPATGKLLVQKRSANRKLFPGCWEIPGGHVEDGESHETCIRRELREETGMTLRKIHGKVHEFAWPSKKPVVNSVYLIEAQGTFKAEAGQISEHRWISPREAGLLLKEGEAANGLYEAAQHAFRKVKDMKQPSLGSKKKPGDYEQFLPFMHDLGDMARKIALKYFRADLRLKDKDDKTPVTIADQEIEERMRARIRKAFPRHGIIGEEYGRDGADAEFVWVIDPIDGTKAFATGKPLFGTIVGLAHETRPVVGMIDQAFTKERWTGAEGLQAQYNGKSIRVAPARPLSDARFYTAAPEMFHGERFENFERLRKATKWTLYGCDCYAYGLLSMGQVDLVMEQYLGVHDIIGLVPIIKSAGGYVSDWQGRDISLDMDGTIVAASSAALGKQTLTLMNKGFPTQASFRKGLKK